MLYLIIALANLIYGLLLFSTITAETPGVTIVLTVASILSIFGGWGVWLWFKQNFHKTDEIPDREPLENWWKMVRAFDIILVIGLFCRFFVVQPFIVDGPSMGANFHNNEAILVDKLSMKLRAPVRGEVIIFKAPPQPSEDYIKRVIGLPGENIKIEQGKVYINDRLLSETYLTAEGVIDPDEVYEKTLGPNEYFVMGDNRPHSSDSRSWGPVPKANLIGRAAAVVYPLSDLAIVKNPRLPF